jgi:nitrogen regulatory protein PII
MKLIKCIVRPNKVEEVREALEKASVSGMTITEVRGHGHQKGHKAVYRGREYDISLLPKSMIELAVSDDLVDDVIAVEHEMTRQRSVIRGEKTHHGRINGEEAALRADAIENVGVESWTGAVHRVAARHSERHGTVPGDLIHQIDASIVGLSRARKANVLQTRTRMIVVPATVLK